MSAIEFLVGPPPPYSNHVVIERTPRGTYRCDGVSNVGVDEPLRFSSPHFNDIEEAKVAAAQWATRHGVTSIFLPPAS